jgi:hypothetical protein
MEREVEVGLSDAGVCLWVKAWVACVRLENTADIRLRKGVVHASGMTRPALCLRMLLL